MTPLILGLLSSGLRLVANAVLVKGKEFIKEKTGIDLEDSKASLSEEDIATLRQFEIEHEEELLRLQLEENKLGLEETKAYLADVQDARAQQTAVQTSKDAPWYVKAVQPALAILVVLTTILLFALFVYWTGDVSVLNPDCTPKLDANGKLLTSPRINETQKDIIIYILGVLSAAITQILGYYFGSSSGSKSKGDDLTTALRQQMSNK